MKASEILEQYASGERNFPKENLRGLSFKGQDLTGVNFSGADIRSTNFTGANLTNANFSHAKAGLQWRWGIFLVLVSWLLIGLSGFLSAFSSLLVVGLIFSTDSDYQSAYQIAGKVILVILLIFLFVTIREGIQPGLGVLAIAGAIGIVGAGAFAGATEAGAGAIAIAFGGAFAIVVAIAVAIARAIARAIAVAIAIAGAIAGVKTFAFSYVPTFVQAVSFDFTGARAVAIAVAVTVALVLFSTYISWCALKGNLKYTLIRDIAVAFAAIGGTSFRSADLSNANFTAATLNSTDFRKAILTCTSFYKTKKLDRVRPGTTYLQKAQVRELLVTRLGQDQNFDRQDLRGVNFIGANLVDTSFVGADLSKANFQNADLSRVKLVQAQLDGTDFTGATLTGAYIRNWNITSDTNFDRVKCEYVYMRLPTKENPDPLRKSDNNKEVFAPGEFGDFIKPIVDTLDLYHNQGVDPRAIAISFKQLAENHPEAELRIVGMEVKGEDKFLLRVKTLDTADKSSLSQEYFEIYNELKALAQRELKKAAMLEAEGRGNLDRDSDPIQLKTTKSAMPGGGLKPALWRLLGFSKNFFFPSAIKPLPSALPGGLLKALISEKDSQIRRLENMVMTALERPSFYSNVEQVGFMTNNPSGISQNVSDSTMYGGMQAAQGNNNTQTQRDTTVSDGRNINTGGGNYNERIEGNYVQGNYYAAQRQSLAEAAAEIQKLLEQLDKSYPTDTTAGKMAIATEAIKYVDSDQTLAQRVLSALKAGGTQALAQFLNHPAASFMIGALDDWQKTKSS